MFVIAVNGNSGNYVSSDKTIFNKTQWYLNEIIFNLNLKCELGKVCIQITNHLRYF